MAFYYYRYSTWKGKTIHLEDLIVYENMRKQISNIARLEDITSSYKAFQAKVLLPFGLSLSESVWVKYADTKINESVKNRG